MVQDNGTAERTYKQLKSDVLKGALSVHVRIDFAELAAHYGVSTTPVREAAMRLLGEGLLESHPKGGTRPAFTSEYRLRALLDLHAKLSLAAADWADLTDLRNRSTGWADVNEGRARQFFHDLAAATGNDEFVVLIDRVSDRLAPFRYREGDVLGELNTEIEQLRAQSGSRLLLRRALRGYHRRRMAVVEKLVWLATSANPAEGH